MKLAFLARLKPGPRRPRSTADDGGAPRRRRRVRGPVLAFAGLVAALGGIGGWLAANGEDTAKAWQDAIPHAVVAVAGAGPAQPTPAPAPAPAAAPAPPPQPPATAAQNTPPGPAPVPGPVEAVAPPPPPPGMPVPGPDGSITLAIAPAPGLTEQTRNGLLPKIAEDGRRAWQAYARPFPPAEKRARVAIVLGDMGLSGVTTGNALQRLPAGVTLAFVPFANNLDDWVDRARTKGHEIILSLPMEPSDFPRSDPGPNALLTGLPPDRNQERLEIQLAKVSGYVGITSTTGSKFTTNADAMKPVIETLKARGLLYVDAKLAPRTAGAPLATQAGVPRAWVDRVLDKDLARGSIDDQLKELETIAKAQGAAVGLGFPYPSTIERISLWAAGLADRGIVLAPVSSVVNIQKGTGG